MTTSQCLGAIVALSILVTGCSVESDVGVEGRSSSIHHGSPSAEPGVGRILTGGGGCTGVVVKNRCVLTAGHCMNPTMLFTLDSTPSEASSYELMVRSATLGTSSYNDLGIIYLTDLDGFAWSPRGIASGMPDLARHDPVKVVGYGLTDWTPEPAPSKLEGILEYWNAWQHSTDGAGAMMELDDDEHGQWVRPGDSGGPAFLNGNVTAITGAGNYWWAWSYHTLLANGNETWVEHHMRTTCCSQDAELCANDGECCDGLTCQGGLCAFPVAPPACPAGTHASDSGQLMCTGENNTTFNQNQQQSYELAKADCHFELGESHTTKSGTCSGTLVTGPEFFMPSNAATACSSFLGPIGQTLWTCGVTGGQFYACCEPDVMPPSCSDGACDAEETCATCPSDCGPCPPVCGDGACDPGEDCMSCGTDCGWCPLVCGDGICDPGESEDCYSCGIDCGVCAPLCGDLSCNGAEDCSSCSYDCGPCEPSCGDGVCHPVESCEGCASDCGECTSPYCGDGTCDAAEDCQACATDCGSCAEPDAGTTCEAGDCDAGAPMTCGDGLCDGIEDCDVCPADCGACASPVDCRTQGCPAGDACISCWAGWACVPAGAVC